MYNHLKEHYSKKTFIVNGVKLKLNKKISKCKLYGCPGGELI